MHRPARDARAAHRLHLRPGLSPPRSRCCSRWPPPPPCCPHCSASSGCGCCPAGNAAGWPPTGPRPTAASGAWTRLAAFVQRHPAPLAAAAATVMLVLAIPVLSLRLGSSDAANDPAATTTHQAYELLADGFGPGFNGPLQLVGSTSSPADVAAFARLAGELRTEPGIAAVSAPVAGHGASLISVIPASLPRGQGHQHPDQPAARQRDPRRRARHHAARLRRRRHRRRRRLRRRHRPQAADLRRGHPRALAFLLLLVAFRSLLIPAVAAIMNLLAAAAVLRRAGRRLPVRLGTAAAQPRPGRARSNHSCPC